LSTVGFPGVEVRKTSQNPNPSHTEGFGTPASFSRGCSKLRCRAEGLATRLTLDTVDDFPNVNASERVPVTGSVNSAAGKWPLGNKHKSDVHIS
jgi:hypothetical protein